jgi:hypothetical protein
VPRTRHIAFALALVAALVAALGWIYWYHAAHEDAYRCLYGDPVCSLTVATWILVIATSSAFLAAFKGAKEAVKAFRTGVDSLKASRETLDTAQRALMLEQASLFGERRCLRDNHNAPGKDWWLDDELRYYEETRPFDAEWQPPDRHDFFNLGRSALVQPSVDVIFKTSQTERRWTIYFPGIPTDQDVHMSFHFLKSLGQVNVRFTDTEPGNRRDTLADLLKEKNTDATRMRFFGEPREVPAIVSNAAIGSDAPGRNPELPQPTAPTEPGP